MSADAGIVAPVPKGAWDSATSYEKMNIVSNDGYVYMAYQDNTGHEPTAGASDTYWMLLVSGGVVSVDSEMSDSSTNPVQNAVITAALEDKVEKTTITENTYDSSTTYAVGDFFLYNDVLYYVIVEATGVTPPNTSYYTAYTITDYFTKTFDAIGDVYNSSTTYGPTDNTSSYPSYCIEDNVLYKNLVSCTGVAPSDDTSGTYWEATDIATELSSLNSEISNHSTLSNYVSNVTVVSNNSLNTAYAPITLTKGLWLLTGGIQGIDSLTSASYRFELFFKSNTNTTRYGEYAQTSLPAYTSYPVTFISTCINIENNLSIGIGVYLAGITSYNASTIRMTAIKIL